MVPFVFKWRITGKYVYIFKILSIVINDSIVEPNEEGSGLDTEPEGSTELKVNFP